jgi:hypothetical protein
MEFLVATDSRRRNDSSGKLGVYCQQPTMINPVVVLRQECRDSQIDQGVLVTASIFEMVL